MPDRRLCSADVPPVTTPPGSLPEQVALLDALDLPVELHGLQNIYWEARREWEALDAAYALVTAHLISKLERES